MEPPLLEVNDLCFSYPGDEKVLNGISFSLASGERVELAGANGAGKTTFFRCLTGLEKNWSGIIRLAGQSIRSEKDFQGLRRKVGYSLQNAEDQLFFPSVMEDVCFGPLNLGLDEMEAQNRALATLETLGIGNLRDAISLNLSGGQQKLVALAAVLAMQPEILLLDEPLNGLDARAAACLLQALEDSNAAMMIVSHDGAFFSKLVNRSLKLRNGSLE